MSSDNSSTKISRRPDAILVGDPSVVPEPGDGWEVTLRENGFPAMSLRVRVVLIMALIVLALASLFPLRETFSAPETYTDIIATLDTKKVNVMGLVTACTAASAGISAIPGDAGTPIAEELMDISTNLMIVLAVIYLEKYLLTIFGLATFALLVPISCALLAVWVAFHDRVAMAAACAAVAAKLLVLGLVLMLTVPASVKVSEMIDATFQESLEASAEEVAVATEPEAVEEEGGFDPFGWAADRFADLTEGIVEVSDEVLTQVNNLIERIAVMIVTSCLIPIVVLVFFLWVTKLVLGVNIDAPMGALKGRASRMMRRPGSSARKGEAPAA